MKYAKKILMTTMVSCYFEETVEGLKSKGLL